MLRNTHIINATAIESIKDSPYPCKC